MHNIQQKYAIPRRNQTPTRLAALANLALPNLHSAQPRQAAIPYRQTLSVSLCRQVSSPLDRAPGADSLGLLRLSQ